MTQKLRPVFNRIVVRPIREQKQGSIIIPLTAQEKPEIGEVVAIGDRLSANIKVGDTVLFGRFSGADIKVDNESLLFMRDEDVLGVIDNVEA